MLGRQVLLVESDADLAEALREGLASTYQVRVVDGVSGALAVLERSRPDLVLLDLALPGGGGLHVLDWLNGMPEQAPPLIVTGSRTRDPELAPFQHLVAAFLTKPFHLERLLNEVHDVLMGWQPPELDPVLSGQPSVLLAGGDRVRAELAPALRAAQADVVEAGSLDEAVSLLEFKRFDTVVVDWVLPGGTGRTLLEHSRINAFPLPVVVLTANATPQFAQRALSLGAADVLPNSCSPAVLLMALEKIQQRGQRGWPQAPAVAAAPAYRSERPAVPAESRRQPPGVASRQPKLNARYGLEDIIGISPAIQSARTALMQVARMDSTVLITGETGTGKELFAHALHNQSSRSNGPFVAVNAAAIPETLLEAELFGYLPGAFTGAKREGHRGKFQLASGGTLFLDEVGDLPMALQAKLLRVLQEGEIDPVGGQAPQRVDVRLVAATHRDLNQMVREGLFRSDLFFRLNVVNIQLPTLRERPEDILPLAESFMLDLVDRYRLPLKRFSPEAVGALKAHAWPGNVRELRNAVEQAFVFTPSNLIGPQNMPVEVSTVVRTEKMNLAAAERDSILRALDQTQGNKALAARVLGISRAGLYIKLRVYGIA